MNKNFLVVTNQPKSSWVVTIKRAVSALGLLQVVSEEDLESEITRTAYDMVLIDSSAVADATRLVSHLHSALPSTPIVVAALSRSWRRTREALRAGATDYVLKSLTSEELASTIMNVLSSEKLQPVPSTPATSKATILFADNDPDLLATSRESLEKAGYTVITANNPIEARRKLEIGGIDLAILDIRLEKDNDERDLSGLMLAKRIARSTPKIIVTNFPSYGYVREALRPQLDGLPVAVDILARDEGFAALLTTVEDILKTVSEQREGVRPKHKVFVAHGHDQSIKEAVTEFLEGVGLVPIILAEQADGGDTIIEKFERYSREANFAVALFTADDVGYPKKNPAEIKSRARQNVIFEFGYLLAKLGRRRVRVLYQSGVEIPTNVMGFVYIELDDTGRWKSYLRRELKDAGLPVITKMAF